MDASKNGYGTTVTGMLRCVPGSLRLRRGAAPEDLRSCSQGRGWTV
ncbi:hypothetical protein [Actinomyces wuliandei]|nr:hypothetical protein [Actinomyces wuliandei]